MFQNVAGLCGALVIVGGLVCSGIAGIYVDKTKKFEETAKVMIQLAVVASCLVLIVSHILHYMQQTDCFEISVKSLLLSTVLCFAVL